MRIKHTPAAIRALAPVPRRELQGKIAGPTFSLPTNTAVSPPPGMPSDVALHGLDWAYVADNRAEWVSRWDREMAI